MNRADAARELDVAHAKLLAADAYGSSTGTDRNRYGIVLDGCRFGAQLARELTIDAARARVTTAMLLEVFRATGKTKAIRAANPNRYADTRIGQCETALGRALAALQPTVPPPAPEPVPQPTPASPLFDYVGVFVDNVNAFDFRMARSVGRCKWWTPQLANGNALRADNLAELTAHRDAYAASGMTLVPWVVCYAEPELEAARTVQVLDALDELDLLAPALCVNGEADWIGTTRARRYLDALRQLLGVLPPILFSVLGSAAGENVYPLDYPLLAAFGELAPQAYPGITEAKFPGQSPTDYSVTRSVDHYVRRAGFPLAGVNPTLGLTPTERGSYTLQRFVDELDAAGTLGFSLYLGENTTEAEYRFLAAAAAERGLAAVD